MNTMDAVNAVLARRIDPATASAALNKPRPVEAVIFTVVAVLCIAALPWMLAAPRGVAHFVVGTLAVVSHSCFAWNAYAAKRLEHIEAVAAVEAAREEVTP